VPNSTISGLGSTTPGGSFDVAGKQAELAELRARASAPDLWEDQREALEVTRRLARHEQTIAQIESLASRLEDAEVLLDMAVEESDEATLRDVAAELTSIGDELARLEREALFFGEYDDRPAIMTIHAGAGGVDAQDWAEMLFRMYTRYLDRAGFRYEVDEYQEGEEAGIKSVTITIEGDHPYGTFEGERGVHRLVRISPFDAQARRHTSFAAVDVVPEVEVEEVEINPDDLRIETFRSQGAGGQHVNVTDSAVRITHLPTGIVVSCQDERSQHRNREKAFRILRARLYERALREREEQRRREAGDKKQIDFGSQIRSYVLAPYRMVKDHRTGLDVGDVDRVLDGDLGPFMKAWLLDQGRPASS